MQRKKGKKIYPEGTTHFASECGCSVSVHSGAKFFGMLWCKEHQELNFKHALPISHRLMMMIEELTAGPGPYYDEAFGDDKVCECGHSYYRHFDSWENMMPVGCKYCGCLDFKEKQ